MEQKVDANLRDVQKLCSTKSSKVQGISSEVMKFRSQIQEWYTKLERSSPLSPHLLRQNSSDSGQQEPAVSIPILSPISSPQSEAAASPSRVSRGGTPPQEASTPDSDGFPPTPKMSATPSTCDVLGHKKKKRGGKETSSAAVCLTPEFPILTPAGLRASKRKSPLPLDRSSPSTPNLDSTPTTTIQLSPSHFILDDVLDGGDNDACSPAAAAVVGTQNKSSNDSSEVEEKLMSSLYAFNFEKKKKSEKVHSKSGEQESKQNKVRKAFDIQQFPAIFRSGNGSVELEQVYRKVEELSVLVEKDIKKVFPQFEQERVKLLLEVLSSRDYIDCAKNREGNGSCWRIC